MGTLTTDDRKRRIEQDDGDPDDIVCLTATASASTTTVYHDNSNCASFRSGAKRRTLTREMAQAAFKAPCLRCVLERPSKSARSADYGDRSYYEALLNHSGEDLDTPTSTAKETSQSD